MSDNSQTAVNHRSSKLDSEDKNFGRVGWPLAVTAPRGCGKGGGAGAEAPEIPAHRSSRHVGRLWRAVGTVELARAAAEQTAARGAGWARLGAKMAARLLNRPDWQQRVRNLQAEVEPVARTPPAGGGGEPLADPRAFQGSPSGGAAPPHRCRGRGVGRGTRPESPGFVSGGGDGVSLPPRTCRGGAEYPPRTRSDGKRAACHEDGIWTGQANAPAGRQGREGATGVGFRFQKRIRLGRLARLNVSRRGVGISVGMPGARVSVGPSGVRTTLGLPGTGIYYEQRLPVGKARRKRPQAPAGGPQVPVPAGVEGHSRLRRPWLWIAAGMLMAPWFPQLGVPVALYGAYRWWRVRREHQGLPSGDGAGGS